MNWGKIIAIGIIILSIAASIAYVLQRDYRRAIYWAGCAVLFSPVTF